jgi:hypothetical protein
LEGGRTRRCTNGGTGGDNRLFGTCRRHQLGGVQSRRDTAELY